MKRYHALLLTTLLMTCIIHAQKLRLNVSAGVDRAVFAVSGIEGGPIKHKSGIGGGLDLEMNCSSIVSVQVGAHYMQQGSFLVDADGTAGGAFYMDYLAIPLLLRLKATSGFHFIIGPQVGILLSAKSKNIGAAEIDAKDAFKSSDIAAVFGAQYRFANGIFAGASYHHGFQNIVDDDQNGAQVIKNRCYSFRVGYSFSIGK